MAGNNGSGEFRDKIVLNIDQKMDEILTGIGLIQGQIKVLQNNSERQEKEFTKTVARVSQKMAKHIKDHKENPDIMGFMPVMKKYLKPHWRIVLLVVALVQIGVVALVLLFGVGKVF
jgi:hypothetical protein